MISIFFAENGPYYLWTTLNGDLAQIGRRTGEWAWVGRCDDVAGNAESQRELRKVLRELIKQ